MLGDDRTNLSTRVLYLYPWKRIRSARAIIITRVLVPHMLSAYVLRIRIHAHILCTLSTRAFIMCPLCSDSQIHPLISCMIEESRTWWFLIITGNLFFLFLNSADDRFKSAATFQWSKAIWFFMLAEHRSAQNKYDFYSSDQRPGLMFHSIES